MSVTEALTLLGYGHPAMRGKFLSQRDKDAIARLILELAREAEDGKTSDGDSGV